MCQQFYSPDSVVKALLNSSSLKKGRRFLSVHRKSEFNLVKHMYEYDFITSQLVWKSVRVQHATCTNVMWKLKASSDNAHWRWTFQDREDILCLQVKHLKWTFQMVHFEKNYLNMYRFWILSAGMREQKCLVYQERIFIQSTCIFYVVKHVVTGSLKSWTAKICKPELTSICEQ